MSTRCNIHFCHGKDVVANIYRHGDGYPGKVSKGEKGEYGVLSDLLDFFRLLKAEVPDNRLNHAEYLAAKFLVWQAKENARWSRIYNPAEGPVGEDGYGPEHYLQFLSVAPCMQDHGDIEYVYEVDCEKRDREGFPAIRVKKAIPFAEADAQPKRWRTVYLCGKPTKAAA